MRFEQLSDEQVNLFIAQLKNGLKWSNGLMGRIAFRYTGEEFVREMQDMREPEIGPFYKHYDEPEFRKMLCGMNFQYYVYDSLVAQLAGSDASRKEKRRYPT